jgi:hypothetical protein
MLAVFEALIILALVGGAVFALRRWIDYERAQGTPEKKQQKDA